MPPDSWEEFLATLNGTPEAKARLERYAALLVEWNAKFNLVADSTLPHLWTRHFLDSAQLLDCDPSLSSPKTVVADIGSGAGFPALVLAILSPAQFHLIESIGKKARFLQHVITELELTNVTLHHDRAENLRDFKADLVTARAVAAIPDLLTLARPLLKPAGVALFLKGKTVAEELTNARRLWDFEVQQFSSRTDPGGLIVRLSKVTKRHGR